MKGDSNQDQIFGFLLKKCQDLKITTYESLNHAETHDGAKLIRSLIGHYELEIQNNTKTIDEFIKNSP